MFRLLPSRFILRPLFFGLFCAAWAACTQPAKPTPHANIPEYEELMASNAAVRFNYLGDSLLSTGNYPDAIAYYQLSMDSAAVNADSFPYYDSKLDLACVHDRLGEFQTAIHMAEPVVEAFIRSGDSTRIGRAYTTLAGFYGKANMREQNIATAKKGFDILKNDSSLIHRCSAYNEMAFTYSDQGQWAAALPLLDTALTLMQASGVLNQLPSMLLNLGNCHRKLEQWPQARQYLHRCAELADSLQQTHVRSKAIERLSQVAEAVGDEAMALKLFKQSSSLKDSVLNREKQENLQNLEMAYQTKEKEYQIASLQMEQQVTLAHRNLVYVLALLALLAVLVVLFQVNAKLKNSRQTLQRYHQDLKLYADMLLAKNTQLLELENNMPQNNGFKPSNSNGKEAFDPEEDQPIGESEPFYNSRILTPGDWEIFRQRFENAYPGYLLRLRTKEPNLSGAEERLFLLIKLGFNTQEIAFILGISTNGVKKGRQRLRKKLDLQVEEDLDRFILEY